MKENKIKFVIDFSWLHSRSRFAFKDLTWEVEGVTYGTGTIHGVYEALMTVLETFGKDTEIILAMDGVPWKQRLVTSAYKAGREDSNVLGTVELSRWDVAKHFTVLDNVKLAYHKWMEADETMGFIAKTKKDNETVILFSGDGDLRQLIDSGKGIYCAYEYKRGQGYTLEDENHLYNQGIKDLAGLEPSAVALHLAICGDSSDGIPGISRFLRAVSKEISNKAKTIDGLKDMVNGLHNVEDAKLKKGLVSIREEMKMVEDNWKLTNIDPIFIPGYYTKFDDVDIEWFNKYGCVKAYNDILALTGGEIKNTIEVGTCENTFGSGLDNVDSSVFDFETQ